jgi:hypothetical protein
VCRMDREVVTRVATGESWSEELEAVWARGRDTEDRSSVPRVRCHRDGASAAEAAAVVLGLGYTHGWSVPRVSPARSDSWTSRWRAQPPQQQIVNSPAANKDIRHLFWAMVRATGQGAV